MNTGKNLGLILVGIGVGICLISTLWLGASAASGKFDDIAAPILGGGLAFVIAAPLLGAGAYMLIKGQQESKEMAYVQQERKLLGLVQTQGQVNVDQAALEMRVNRETIKEMVYDLVEKGFFTGYINWQQNILYSQDAEKMKAGSRCPNCGGSLTLAGKGVVRCPYCGTDIFLS